MKRIANNQAFLDLIDLTDEQLERLYHEELALRFISLHSNLKNVKTSIAQHMTAFMKAALDNKDFDYTNHEHIFVAVFNLLKPLGSAIFRQKDKQFATALYDVITIGIAEHYDDYKNQDTKIILDKINNEVRTDAVLLKFSRKGGNNQKVRIINRLKESKRIFGK